MTCFYPNQDSEESLTVKSKLENYRAGSYMLKGSYRNYEGRSSTFLRFWGESLP